MKKCVFLFLLVFVCVLAGSAEAVAQKNGSGKGKKPSEKTRAAARAIYVNLTIAEQTLNGQTEMSLSTIGLQYDQRLVAKKGGWGSRSDGLGFYGGVAAYDNDGLRLMIPFGANYLLGKQSHHLEVGAGATYLSPPTNGNSKFIGSMALGYRFQPAKGGSNARIGIGPSLDFDNDELPFVWKQFYISGGIAFR